MKTTKNLAEAIRHELAHDPELAAAVKAELADGNCEAVWIEYYGQCGCVSEPAPKHELLGYCCKHGNKRTDVWLHDSKADPQIVSVVMPERFVRAGERALLRMRNDSRQFLNTPSVK